MSSGQNNNESQEPTTSPAASAPPGGETTANGNSLARSRWHSAAILSSNSVQLARRIPRFVFDPDSSLVFYWMAAVAASTLYNAWMIALRISFPEVRQEPIPIFLSFLDNICDIIYMLDIVVQLRTAYLLDGIPVFHPPDIRSHYTRQAFFLHDMVSVVPTETVVYWIPEYFGDLRYVLCVRGAARLSRLAKFHSVYRFYDLAERELDYNLPQKPFSIWCHLAKLPEEWSDADISCANRTSNPHCIRLLRLSLSLVIIIHWIACLYYLASEYEGLGSNEWVYTDDPSQQRFLRKYIICFYWSAMTLTTIGTDNNPPETDLEYVFTGGIFLTGVFVFATVLGNVGDVISSMNANRQEFQARMDHIKMYLTHKKVPASLQLKIKKWAEYSWSRTKATDESRLLNMLPERLRAEVAMHVHLDSLRKVKIFEQCEIGFLCELVLKLRSQVFSPGDFICKAGETGREMFIINHGKVEVLVTSPATNKEMVVAVLCEGNYFGEISLLRLDGVQNRRTADVRSVGYSELLCLSRRDLMAALVEYPEAKTILESQAKQRIKINKQAQRAFSVDIFMRNSQEYASTDSGCPSTEDMRGGDMKEIKAMIEELKIVSQRNLGATSAEFRHKDKWKMLPGKKIWQLIAKCDALQAKLDVKEKEVHESRMRVVELETLLSMRHNSKSRNTAYEVAPYVLGDRTVRLTSRITKQYSQEEGRYNHISVRQLLDTPAGDTSSDSSEGKSSSITDFKGQREPLSIRQDTLVPLSNCTHPGDVKHEDISWEDEACGSSSGSTLFKNERNFVNDRLQAFDEAKDQYGPSKKLAVDWIQPAIPEEDECVGKSSHYDQYQEESSFSRMDSYFNTSAAEGRRLGTSVGRLPDISVAPGSFEELPDLPDVETDGDNSRRFLRLHSIGSCHSDESSSRRNSTVWDSDDASRNSDTD